MPDIDVEQDLAQINIQLEDLVAQVNKVNQDRENLMQQIHNLNGIAMYLRGKQQERSIDEVIEEDLERSEGYPDEALIT